MSGRRTTTLQSARSGWSQQLAGESRAGSGQLPLPAVLAGVCLGYYFGTLLGLQLRLPGSTPSILWPPNAILASALLLTQPRHWWLVLLAVVPVHVYLQLGTGWSLLFVMSIFITNAFEALLAASALYVLSDAVWRFDTLPRLEAFLTAALGAATLSSFADAAVVHWLHREAYWDVWWHRLFSNALAQLAIVPALVGGVTEFVRWWPSRRFSARLIEASMLGIGVVALSWVDVNGWFKDLSVLRASRESTLAIELPFLIWAAVRFGPAGTGLTVLTITMVNAWAAAHSIGPYSDVVPSSAVTSLTLSLTVVAITLLYLATLMEERRRAQHELRRRLELEGLLSRLSAALVQEPSDQMQRPLDTWLGPIAAALGLESLTLFSAESGRLLPVYSWVESRINVASTASQHLAWAQTAIGAAASDNGDQPRFDEETGLPLPWRIASARAVPLVGAGELFGVLALGPMRGGEASADLPASALVMIEVLTSALGRRRSEDALRESEGMKSTILRSLTSGVAVVDRDGRLIQTNDRWARMARECDWMDVRVGGSLIDRIRRVVDDGSRPHAALADGLAAVLETSRDRFTLEESTDGPESRWWSVTAVPLLQGSHGGAVVTRADITELRDAQMEVMRSRQQLAHVTRVSTVAVMTASIAHQLNQPLAAILTNAQTAHRMLSFEPPNVPEMRAILKDIVADEQRASDVILGLRRLLRQDELSLATFDLIAAIEEVIMLVSSEAIIRNATIELETNAGHHFVRGDRVQLQQVILTLLQNAMEAMSEVTNRERTIVISCSPDGGERIRVRVRDSGPGLPNGMEETLFEPFYTTKPEGMGMGLSIARSILEAHEGSIHASNADGGGAAFEFVLPAGGTRMA